MRIILSRAQAHVERALEKLYAGNLSRSAVRRSLQRVEDRLLEAGERYQRVLTEIDTIWRERYERLEKTADAMVVDFDRTTEEVQRTLSGQIQLQEQCRALEAEVQALSARRAEDEQRIRAAEDRVVTLESEREQIRLEAEAVRSDMARQHAGVVSSLEAKLGDAESRLSSIDTATSELTDQHADVVAALESKLREVETRLSSTDAERASAEAERQRLTAFHLEQTQAYEERVQALTQSLAASQAEREQQNQALEELLSELEADRAAEREQHRRDLEAATSDLASQHTVVVSALQAKLREVDTRLGTTDAERASVHAERERLAALHHEQKRVHEERVQSLRVELADLERRLAQETEAKEAARSRIRARLDRIGKREHEFEARASAFGERIAALEGRSAELAQGLQHEDATRTHLEETIQELQARLLAAGTEAESSKAARTQSESAWASERAELRATCQESESRLSGLQRELSQAQAALRTAKEALAHQTEEMRGKIGAAASQADELQSVVETLQDRLAQLEQGTRDTLTEERERADALLAEATARTNEAIAQYGQEQSSRSQLRRRTTVLRRLFHARLAGVQAQIEEQARASLQQARELQELLAQEQTARLNASHSSEEALRRIEQLSRKVESLEGELQKSTQQATELSKSITRLSTSLQDSEAQLVTARAQVERGQAALARLETERARERTVGEEALRTLRVHVAELETWVESRKSDPGGEFNKLRKAHAPGHSPTGQEPRPIAQPLTRDLPIDRLPTPQPATPDFPGPPEPAIARLVTTGPAGIGSPPSLAAQPNSDEVDYLSHAIDHLLLGIEPPATLRATETPTPAASPAPSQAKERPAVSNRVPAEPAASAAFEQETAELRKQFHQLFDQSQFPAAADAAVRILNLAKQHRSTKHDYLDVCHRDLAIAQMLAGQLNEARDNLLQALKRLEQIPQGTVQASYAMRLADLAMVTLRLGQPHPAKQLLEQAVGIAQSVLAPDDTIRREIERGLSVVRKQCEPPLDPGYVFVTTS